MNTLETLRVFVTNNLALGGGGTLSDGDDLLERGVLDSLGIMKLVVFIEDSFDLRVDDEEIVPENFHSISCIAGFVEEKMAESPPRAYAAMGGSATV